MNLPNLLSISRVPVVFLIVYLMVRNTETTNCWAFGLFVASALTDWLDGYLARKLNQITDLGKFLDALADKVLTSGLFIALVALDRMGEDGDYILARDYDDFIITLDLEHLPSPAFKELPVPVR